MVLSIIDPCLMILDDNIGNLEGLIAIKVDDTLIISTKKFLKEEKQESKLFKSNPESQSITK